MSVRLLPVLVYFVAAVKADHTALHDLAQSNIAFAKTVYNALAKGTTCDDINDVVFSPLALQAGLSAMYVGARGATAKELESVLKLNSKQLGRMPQGFQVGLPVILKEPRLRFASVYFADNSVHILPEFQKMTNKTFFTDVVYQNFRKEPESAVEAINYWVEAKTDKIIKKLALPESVDSSTQFLIGSAVHYDGVWRDPVGKSPGERIYGLQYSGRLLSGFFSDLGIHVVQIPYQLTPESSKSKGLKLLLIVPVNGSHSHTNLHESIQKINFETIEEELYARDAQLFGSNLDLEQSYSLKDVLKKLGMTSLFDGNTADLDGVAQENLKVDDVFHTASIKLQDERDVSIDDHFSDDKGDNVIRLLGSYSFIVQDPTSKAIILMGRKGC